MRLRIIEGDISGVEAEALVNAANNHLWMGGGVAGALKRAGGRSIEIEAMSNGPIPVGSAVATGAGNLNARYIIHGAVMGPDLRTDPEKVERTTRSCLELAVKLGVRSIALPAFGCGVEELDFGDSAQAMKRAILSMENELREIEIIVVLYGETAYRVFSEFLGDEDLS